MTVAGEALDMPVVRQAIPKERGNRTKSLISTCRRGKGFKKLCWPLGGLSGVPSRRKPGSTSGMCSNNLWPSLLTLWALFSRPLADIRAYAMAFLRVCIDTAKGEDKDIFRELTLFMQTQGPR